MSSGPWTDTLMGDELDEVARVHEMKDILDLVPLILRSVYLNTHPSTATEARLMRASRIAEGKVTAVSALLDRQLAAHRADIAVLADYRTARRAGSGPRAA